MTGPDIPTPWREAAARIAAAGPGRILVIGATDRGKSTFCAYLCWYLLRHDRQPAFVDADVGQKDVGPPATISLARPRLDAALASLPPAALYFVGAVSPLAHLLPMVVGTRQLAEQADGDFVVVNTSGLVFDVGRVLKTYQIDALRPDWIVALEQDRELTPILAAHRHFRILRLPASPHARVKTPTVRRQHRQAAFQFYFRRAREVVLPLADLIVQRAPVAGAWPAVLTPGRLCALADSDQQVQGLALITGFDPEKRLLTLSTPAAETGPVLQLGDVSLDPASFAQLD